MRRMFVSISNRSVPAHMSTLASVTCGQMLTRNIRASWYATPPDRPYPQVVKFSKIGLSHAVGTYVYVPVTERSPSMKPFKSIPTKMPFLNRRIKGTGSASETAIPVYSMHCENARVRQITYQECPPRCFEYLTSSKDDERKPPAECNC